jgi:iron complex outermembrane receptor protein
LGVPANVNSSAALNNVYQIGNPHLQPETSRSRGIGFVYTPAWLEGFNASVDWYDIRIRDAVGDLGYQATVYDCYARNSDPACAQITRAADGSISQVTDFPQNVPGGIETEGYDIALSYRHATPFGNISARWNTNYVDYFGEIGKPAPGSPLPDGSTAQGNVVGLNSPNLALSSLFGVIWRLRSQMQLVWDRAPWSASITGRYFSHIDEDCSVVINIAQQLGDPSLNNLCSNPNNPILIGGNPVPENRVPSVTFTDLEGSWDAPWHARMTLGVRNAFDRNPPVAYSAMNSFFPDYDLPGRFWYASYRQKF